MLKTKGLMFGAAVAIVAGALAIASMAITTTSGAGTDVDDDPTPVATATTAPSAPPQAPIEPPADTNAGDSAGAGTAGLPNAGYGIGGENDNVNLWVLLAIAGGALAAGTGFMAAARSNSRR
jgi:hypothetical protein